MPPPVAVIVRVEVPAAAFDPAVSVNVLVPAPGEAIVAGAKLAVTPVGSPLIAKATAALNPFTRAVVKVIGVEAPAVRLALEAPGVRVKLGATIVRVKLWVLVVPPPTAPRVRLYTPAAAFEPAVSVTVLVPVPGAAMLDLEKLAVTPLGSTPMDR